MRLGVLAPGSRSPEALRAAAEFLLDGARVERVVYLGTDGALERVVEAWARELVGGAPTLAGLRERARACVARRDPEELSRLVASERRLLRLAALESLPAGAEATLDLCDGKVALLVVDKARVDEEDLIDATYVVFGQSSRPVVHRAGTRWFLSPGPHGEGGLAMLAVDQDGPSWTAYRGPGDEGVVTPLASVDGARLRVSSA